MLKFNIFNDLLDVYFFSLTYYFLHPINMGPFGILVQNDLF
jgi:hypothetical protein